MRISGVLAGGLIAAIVATGCVGSIDRQEFESEARARGGGMSADRLIEAMDRIQRRSQTAELRVRTATISFMMVDARVSTAERPEEVDVWYLAGSLVGPTPGSNLDENELESYFVPSDLDEDVIERAIDDALSQSSIRAPWASSVSFVPAPDGGYRATVLITNEREDEQWEFGPDGDVRRIG